MAAAAKKVIPEVGKHAMKKQKSEFVCEIRYLTDLPEPPLDPKLLKLQLPEDRLITYCSSALERKHKAPLLCEKLLGIPIDMVDQEQFQPSAEERRQGMHPRDAALFVGQASLLAEENKNTRGDALIGTTFTWLERNTYLQNNLYDMQAKKNISETQRQLGVAMEAAKNKEELTRDQQIEVIRKTFDSSHLVHPDHPEWQPVKVMNVFPHPGIDNEHTYVLYDNALHKGNEEGPEEAKRSVLRSYSDTQHSVYMPATEAADAETYSWARELRRNPTPPVVDLNNFYFMIYKDEVLFNRFQKRLNLRKRTQTNSDKDANASIEARPSTISLDFQPIPEEGGDSDADEKALFGDDDSEDAGETGGADGETAGGGEEVAAASDVDDEDM